MLIPDRRCAVLLVLATVLLPVAVQAQTGAITGTVTSSSDGAPIVGAEIAVFRADGGLERLSLTNASGVFTASELADGTYFVRSQSGLNFVDELYNNLPCFPSCTVSTGTPVVIASGATSPNVDFTLTPGLAISGVVTDASTGSPINGVMVLVYSSAGAFQRSTTTNAAGTYAIVGLPPGTYYARTSTQSHVNELYNNLPCFPTCTVTTGQPLAGTPGTTIGSVDFSLTPGASIAGTVTNATTAAPIASLQLQLYTSSGSLVTTRSTNASGAYSFTSIPAGSYYVRTNVTPLQNYINEVYNNVVCAPSCPVSSGTLIPLATGGSATGIDFGLEPGASIAGTVTNAVTGAPIAGARVEVHRSNGISTYVTDVLTTTTGAFTFGGLTAGTYVLRTRVASTLNYFDERYNNLPCTFGDPPGCDVSAGTPVVVTAGVSVGGIDFALSPGAVIAGTVTRTSDGAPLAGIDVTAYTRAGEFAGFASTDASGAYALNRLTPGEYVVRASAEPLNYVDEVYPDIACAPCEVTRGAPIPVAASATVNGINFSLDGGGTISGLVTNSATSGPLSSVGVSIHSATGALVKSTETDESGVYSVSGLPAGSYRARTSSSTFVDEVFDNNICPGDCSVVSGTPIAVSAGASTNGINFALDAGRSISGTVRNSATTLPINGNSVEVEVHLYSSAGLPLDYTYINGSGVYSFPGLAPGSYFLRVFNFGGYVDEVYSNVAATCITCPVTHGTPVVVSGSSVTGVDFSLDPGARIAGHVTEFQTGQPIPWTEVRVYNAAGTWVAMAETNQAGAFTTYQGLAPGTYYLRTLSRSGYIDEIYSNMTWCAPACLPTAGTPVVVSGTTTVNGIDFVLEPIIDLVRNGSFAEGITHWSLFATPTMGFMNWVAPGGSFRFNRVPPPPGTSNQAVVYQNTGAPVAANAPLVAQFDLANSSSVAKRISVLVHDSDFSDLAVCTFWIPPGLAEARYGLRTRTTKAWANATISFYAASTAVPDGYYEVSGVSLQVQPSALVERTDCIDPFVPPAATGLDGPNLLVNGDFSSGSIAPGWSLFGQIQAQVSGGVFEFVKLSGAPAGVLLQGTGQSVPSYTLLTATFDLGNSSGVRKRVTMLLHDGDFSDLSACTFWIPPGQSLQPYVYRAFTNKPWTNAMLSIYPATVGTEQWIRFDNATLRRTPGSPISGAECIEPAAVGGDSGGTSAADAMSMSPMSVQAATTNQPPVGSAVTAGSTGAAEVGEERTWIADGFMLTDVASDDAEGPSWAAEAVQGRVWTLTSRNRLPTTGPVLALRSRLIDNSAVLADIQVSSDGVVWETVRRVPASEVWISIEVDLSEYASAPVFVRLALTTGENAGAYPSVWRVALEGP